jgi:alanine dehydrogenase
VGEKMMKTLIVPKKIVEEFFTMKEAIEAVEIAYGEFSAGNTQMPPKKYMYYQKGDLRSMPATFDKTEASGVKVVNVHPENRKLGLPSVMGIIELVDKETGYPIALLDGTSITNIRTGAASGVATKWLSKKDSKVFSFIGAGIQAWLAYLAIKEVRDIEVIKIWSRTESTSVKFATDIYNDGFDGIIEIAESPAIAVRDADVITMTTPSRTPVLLKEDIPKGAHINAIGADAKGKQETEFHPDAIYFIDEWEQASHSGEINMPVKAGQITPDDVVAIGEVINKTVSGRLSDTDITIFDSTGLGLQDIASARIIYDKLMKDGNIEKLFINFQG